MCYLMVYVVVMTILVHRHVVPPHEFWMALCEGLRPVLVRRLDRFRRESPAGDTEG